MLHFNGPALATEARRRLKQSDSPTMDAESSEHLRETAQTYATLALAAAILTSSVLRIDPEDGLDWEAGLGYKRKIGEAA